ncbi:macrophage colony-stimulating factor 1 receptor 1-like [Aplochiton taeniatus]
MVLNGSQEVMPLDSEFTLDCRGGGSVQWSSSAPILRWKSPLGRTVLVRKAEAKHTGTYTCSYENKTQTSSSWVHLYIKDPANVFVPLDSVSDRRKEGEDLFFACLLTDPDTTNLTLQLVDGGAPPEDMNFEVDRHRGVLIRDLKPSHTGNYVCSAYRHGSRHTSKSLSLRVIARLRSPPTVSIHTREFVRMVGEPLQITCMISNPNHFFNVTWTHTSIQGLIGIDQIEQRNNKIYMNNMLTMTAVGHTHHGTFTCTAFNEAGAGSSSTQLRVVEVPYLRLSLQPVQHANTSAGRVEVHEGRDLEITYLTEAYPPVIAQWWETPSGLNLSSRVQETFVRHNNGYEASLLLRGVRAEDRGKYSLHYRSQHYNGTLDLDLLVYQKPDAELRLNNGTLTCSSFGCGDGETYLLEPAVLTYKPGHLEEVQSQLTLPSMTETSTTECVSSNRIGSSRDILVSYVSASSRSPYSELLTPTFIGACSAAVVLFLLFLVILCKYKQKPKYEVRWKIIESNNGNNYTFIDPTQLPYNQKWEFPRERLKLGQVVGAGAFGKVVEATAYGLGTEDNVTRVAVKMLKPSAHSEEREALMSELKILSHLGQHSNIVNLLGACTQGGPMLMITEYCSRGDLLNFLRGRAQVFLEAILSVPEANEARDLYKNMLAIEARVRSDSGISCSSTGQYQEMHPAQSPDQQHCSQVSVCGDQQTSPWYLDIDDLLAFSYQVAQGMDFLASRNCIHRDVAARNVLLTDHHVAKICDFGLARDIMNDSNYIVKGNVRLPVKWMAPESIFDCLYTVQSDVWSYGILLWEIFSLGKSPYPNVVVDTNFYKMIKDGRHMSQPDFAPSEMYDIMTQCWSLEPTDRPTFSTIAQLIYRLLPAGTNQIYRNLQADFPDQATRGEDEEGAAGEGEVSKICEKEWDGLEGVSQEEEQQPLVKSNVYQVC